jgi:hypothetical protein
MWGWQAALSTHYPRSQENGASGLAAPADWRDGEREQARQSAQDAHGPGGPPARLRLHHQAPASSFQHQAPSFQPPCSPQPQLQADACPPLPPASSIKPPASSPPAPPNPSSRRTPVRFCRGRVSAPADWASTVPLCLPLPLCCVRVLTRRVAQSAEPVTVPLCVPAHQRHLARPPLVHSHEQTRLRRGSVADLIHLPASLRSIPSPIA